MTSKKNCSPRRSCKENRQRAFNSRILLKQISLCNIILFLLPDSSSAFLPTLFGDRSVLIKRRTWRTTVGATIPPQNLERVLKEQTSKCPVPYVRFHADTPVIEVATELQAIGQGVAALIFEGDSSDKNDMSRLTGIFTERDYLKMAAPDAAPRDYLDFNDSSQVSMLETAMASIAEDPDIGGGGLDVAMVRQLTPVRQWMTPVQRILAATPSTGADNALRMMRERGVRHLVVSNGVASAPATDVGILSSSTDGNSFAPDTKEGSNKDGVGDPNLLQGVVAINQIVGLLQSDALKQVNSVRKSSGEISTLLQEKISTDYKATLFELQDRQRQLANNAAIESGVRCDLTIFACRLLLREREISSLKLLP